MVQKGQNDSLRYCRLILSYGVISNLCESSTFRQNIMLSAANLFWEVMVFMKVSFNFFLTGANTKRILWTV